jgi:hypothetical protein
MPKTRESERERQEKKESWSETIDRQRITDKQQIVVDKDKDRFI